MYKNYYLLFFYLIVHVSSVFSQGYSEENIYSWFDKQTGIVNSPLFKGIEYVETDRVINEKHQFFQSQDFHTGSLVYDGLSFYGVPMKYHVYHDVLIVNLQHGLSNYFFQLFSNKVDQFELNGHKFRYIKADNNSTIIGFYEVIQDEGPFKILKKYRKNRKELRDKSVAYIEFTNADADYIFQFEDEFFDLNNRRNLISRFPSLKSEIKNFYTKNRKQSREIPETFMHNLALEMNILITTNVNEMME